MKPKYRSHGELVTADLTKQHEEIADMRPDKQERQLPGLSVAQTKFFCRLQERAALYKLALTITPDGEMFAQEHSGQSHSWGSIHDEVRVARLIITMIDATLDRKEVIAMMLKLFPRSKKLGFLFQSQGRN
jgi:hypothetical protein